MHGLRVLARGGGPPPPPTTPQTRGARLLAISSGGSHRYFKHSGGRNDAAQRRPFVHRPQAQADGGRNGSAAGGTHPDAADTQHRTSNGIPYTHKGLEGADHAAEAAQATLPSPPEHAAAAGGGGSGGGGGGEEGKSWWPLDGRMMAFGGGMAAILALAVFRKEMAPAIRWVITNVNNVTDKSVIGEVGAGDWNVEGIATLLALALTLYWSFSEFSAGKERTKTVEGLEAELGGRVLELAERLESAERALADVTAELAELRAQQAQRGTGVAPSREEELGAGEVHRVAAELAKLRREQAAAAVGSECTK